MLLAIDIGNTNIVIGIYEQKVLKHKWRLVSDLKKNVDDYAIDIIELCLNHQIDCLNINGCIIGSVVPLLTSRISEAVKKFINPLANKKILVIGDDQTKLDITIKIKNKNEVGHDRLINSIAGFNKFGGNLIIIDFGTATTFDIVGANGEYLGGIITAGVNLALKALHDMTAQLPKISIKAQKNIIGKSTFEAMNSGVYHGSMAMVKGLLAEIENELECSTKRIITGGIAEIFKDDLLKNKIVDFFEPDLTLDGLKIIFYNN